MNITVSQKNVKALLKLDEEHQLGIFKSQSYQAELIALAKKIGIKFDPQTMKPIIPADMPLENFPELIALQERIENEAAEYTLRRMLHADEICAAILGDDTLLSDVEGTFLEGVLTDFLGKYRKLFRGSISA